MWAIRLYPESGLVSQKWFFGSHRNPLSDWIFGGDSFKHFSKSIDKCSFLSPIEKLRMDMSAARRYPMFFISIEKMAQNCKWPTVLSVTAHLYYNGFMHYNFMTNESLQRIYFKFCTNKFLKSWSFCWNFFSSALPVDCRASLCPPSDHWAISSCDGGRNKSSFRLLENYYTFIFVE